MPEPVSFQEHVFKNVALIGLSLFFLPLDTFVVAACLALNAARSLVFPLRPPLRYDGRRKTVLVSSLAMGKGLCLARVFHLAGHRVVGVDFDTAHFAHARVPSAGRFSRAVDRHYAVTTPVDAGSRARYADEMLALVEAEGADLWVCVSGVASTVEDALLKARIEKQTKCRVFQPAPETCEALHDKGEFIRAAERAGLKTPVTVLVESRAAVLRVLDAHPALSFIAKCVELDDVSRADMTRLPQPTRAATEAFVGGLDISPAKRWVVQQFVHGSEYCTHAVVVRGRVKAFVACASSEMLMHYEALPAEAPVSRAMLAFTRRLLRTLEGGSLTGQLSFDFLVDLHEAFAKDARDIDALPIECNPRTHTAVVLLAAQPQALADAYLALLDQPEPRHKKKGGPPPADDTEIASVLRPNTDGASKTRVHWLGHDVVTEAAMPLWDTLWRRSSVRACVKSLFWFVVRAVGWKDATLEMWDPVPWWFLYHVYYPYMFATSLVTGKRWSRVNVSTTRVFESY